MRRAVFAVAVLLSSVPVALAATPAGASGPYTPEFGRCVRVAKGEDTAGYSDSGCTHATAGSASFRWLAGPGAMPRFTATAGPVGLTLLAAHGRAKPTVECSSASEAGEFTGPTTQALGLTLAGCKMGSSSCQSSGAAAGEVVFSALQGTLVISKQESYGEALVRWSPALGETLASFECAGTSVVIGQSLLHAVKADKMLGRESQRLRVYAGGSQRPECYEPCEPTEEPLSSIGGSAGVVSGLSLTGTQSNEEKIEADKLR